MANFMGRIIMQEPQDMLIWDKFFEDFKVKSFIELGTGYGGMSLYFGLKCRDLVAPFHTFDNITSSDFMMPIEQEINLAKSHHCIDIFSDEGMAMVGGLVKSLPKPLGIFFDNGNKPREWKIYAPLTEPGDYCIVHDWDTEFTQSDMAGISVERILIQECDARGPGWKSMWFKRT